MKALFTILALKVIAISPNKFVFLFNFCLLVGTKYEPNVRYPQFRIARLPWNCKIVQFYVHLTSYPRTTPNRFHKLVRKDVKYTEKAVGDITRIVHSILIYVGPKGDQSLLGPSACTCILRCTTPLSLSRHDFAGSCGKRNAFTVFQIYFDRISRQTRIRCKRTRKNLYS